MSYLADVNVWLALSTPGHTHHRSALRWFDNSFDHPTDRVWFCRVTQMGFLRLVTNPRVMEESVITPDRAWAVLASLLQDPRIGFVEEPEGLAAAWRIQTVGHHVGHNFWTDAYLAGFAAAADLTLLTFDRGFARGKGLSVRVLE